MRCPAFTFGKEMQLHVMEVKANHPFKSPIEFEETMQNAVSTLSQIVHKQGALLLGTGMHPLLKLEDTAIWPHYHRKIYQEYGKIFNLNQHGWLNIQSFHLNLPYQKEADGIQIAQFARQLVRLSSRNQLLPRQSMKAKPVQTSTTDFNSTR